MALKKPDPEESAPPEDRKCECGEFADVVDGQCRRCQLSE